MPTVIVVTTDATKAAAQSRPFFGVTTMSEKLTSYQKRDLLLARMGFASYADYLASPRWQVIRKKVLKRSKGVCECCGEKPSTEVHHRSYGWYALTGRRLEYLVAACRDCHKGAEFREGFKVSHKMANRRMNLAARDKGRQIVGLCFECRCNTTKAGQRLCGKCKRIHREASISK